MSTTFELEGFEPISRIGGGGFGDVWLSRQTNVDRQVAIKVGHSAIQDETIRLRFDRECKALGRLSGHPNIVDVYTAGSLKDGRPYLVLEYINGGTLWQLLKKNPIPEVELRQIGAQMAAALAEAHASGVLHRDLKPENILIRSTGDAVLGDFGIARLHDGANTTSAAITASVAYAAPEILSGKRATVASDLYGIGVCLLAAVFRSVPFVQKTDQSIHPIINRVLSDKPPDVKRHGVSTELAAIIDSLLAKDPAKRPASAAELVEQFAALPPVVEPPPPPTASSQATQVLSDDIDDASAPSNDVGGSAPSNDMAAATPSNEVAAAPVAPQAPTRPQRPPSAPPRPEDAAPGLYRPGEPSPAANAPRDSFELPIAEPAPVAAATPLSEAELRSVPGPLDGRGGADGPYGEQSPPRPPASNMKMFLMAYAATLVIGGFALFLFSRIGDDPEAEVPEIQQAVGTDVVSDAPSSGTDDLSEPGSERSPTLQVPLTVADLSFGQTAAVSDESPGPGGATLCDNVPPTDGLTDWTGRVISTEGEERTLYQIVSRFQTPELASSYIDAYTETNDCESWEITSDVEGESSVSYAALQTPPPNLGDQSRQFTITGQVDAIDSIHAKVLLVQAGTDVLTLTLSGPSTDDLDELDALGAVAIERLGENA